MPPRSSDRVAAHTNSRVNRRILRRTADSVRFHARHPEQIGSRLRELDAEWDTERALEVKTATFSLAGLLLAGTVDRRFLALPIAASAILLQHALQGWSPPLPLLRRMGVRSMREIDEERMALKALRGDFGPLQAPSGDRDDRASHALQAVRY